jgi:alcohol oxidase
MPVYRGEVATDHPKFPEGSEAISKPVDEPVPVDAPKIKYTEADNSAIDEYIRNAGNVKFYNKYLEVSSHFSNITVGTTWHCVSL